MSFVVFGLQWWSGSCCCMKESESDGTIKKFKANERVETKETK